MYFGSSMSAELILDLDIVEIILQYFDDVGTGKTTLAELAEKNLCVAQYVATIFVFEREGIQDGVGRDGRTWMQSTTDKRIRSFKEEIEREGRGDYYECQEVP